MWVRAISPRHDLRGSEPPLASMSATSDLPSSHRAARAASSRALYGPSFNREVITRRATTHCGELVEMRA